jgi:hypothetical protein
MKTIGVLILLIAAGPVCLAQTDTATLVTKRGRPILPKAGEFAIGVDATPFFQYVGNLFNNTANNPSPAFRSPAFPSLVGKYMKSANTAFRVRFSANTLSQEGKNVVDNSSNPDPTVTVTDTKTYNSTYVLLGAGLEKRRGSGRLQGIYGVEAFIGFNSNSSTYTYGNPITPATPNVAFTIWNPNSVTVQSTTFGSSRTLETSSGTSVSFGVTGFVGAEYFFAPKMSLGAEFGYSISSAGSGSGTQKTEYFNFGTGALATTSSGYFPIPGSFSIGTVAQGNLFLNLYF